MDKIYKNKVLTETFRATEDLLSGATIGTWQEDYPLRQVEFEWIKLSKPMTFTWANSILLTTFGFGLNLVAEGYAVLTTNAPPIGNGKWIALSIGLVTSVILYIVGRCLPNKRKEVMAKIEQHFNSAPTRRQVYKG